MNRNWICETLMERAAKAPQGAFLFDGEEAVYTTIYNGRNDSRKAGAMSMMVKTLPVMFRTKDGDGSVAGLVREVGRQLLAGMANDIYSFADIAHAYGIRADVQLVSTPELGKRIGADFAGERISLIDLSILPPMERSDVRKIRRRAPRPGDLFCMLYTSGTTGLPKGALIEHRNVTAFTVQNVRNFRTNSFMGRLRACAVLGCCPYSILDETDRLDPIDAGAAAYVALAKTPECCRLFHATNSDSIPMGNLIRMMNEAGVKVDFVEDDAFAAALDEAMKDPLNAQVLQPLLAYGQAGEDVRVPTPDVNRYTTHVLARMGFFWSSTSDEYVKAFVKALKGLRFFKG